MDNLLPFNSENLQSLSFQKGFLQACDHTDDCSVLFTVSFAGNVTYGVLRSFLTRARQEASGFAWASLSLKTARTETHNLLDCTTLWAGMFSQERESLLSQTEPHSSYVQSTAFLRPFKLPVVPISTKIKFLQHDVKFKSGFTK